MSSWATLPFCFRIELPYIPPPLAQVVYLDPRVARSWAPLSLSASYHTNLIPTHPGIHSLRNAVPGQSMYGREVFSGVVHAAEPSQVQ